MLSRTKDENYKIFKLLSSSKIACIPFKLDVPTPTGSQLYLDSTHHEDMPWTWA
jgi:hypothetical protein